MSDIGEREIEIEDRVIVRKKRKIEIEGRVIVRKRERWR